MNRATVERLNRLNLEFYRECAEEFSRSRRGPWKGWDRVVEVVASPPSGRLDVLDLGCGNGRFASYLHKRVGGFTWVGVDSSAELLEIATARVGSLAGVSAEPLLIDLIHDTPGSRLGGRRFDLIAAFGLLHHLPSFSLRKELLRDAGELLRPSGVLATGFWQFASHERFRRRMVPWQERTAADPVDPTQLEAGDHLLAWGEAGTSVRYCHHADRTEAARLVAGIGLELVDSYLADGDLNLYYLLRRAAG